MIAHDGGGTTGWDDIDFRKNSYAVVVHAGDGEGVVLWQTGPHLQIQVDLCGPCLRDLDLDDAPYGISVWEGRFVHGRPDGYFRRPTPAESKYIADNMCPFPQCGPEGVQNGDARAN